MDLQHANSEIGKVAADCNDTCNDLLPIQPLDNGRYVSLQKVAVPKLPTLQ